MPVAPTAAVLPDSLLPVPPPLDSSVADSGARDSTRGTRRALAPRLPVPVVRSHLFRSVEDRARAGERIAVSVTAYCLTGRTRLGTPVRDGIIAVDRALFPLGSMVELSLGRSEPLVVRAEDTGGAIRGARIDLWMADCQAARRFGRKRGYAALLRRRP